MDIDKCGICDNNITNLVITRLICTATVNNRAT